ncbi:MAG TPA: CBS domain-containing protein [Candidatus Moranbacteria bacterium]|nr:CBS domain-containing protein [Candidatus Moranbacteria bacterium]
MQVRDIMAKEPIFAKPDTKVTEVADILFRHGFHGLPIVENHKVVGILTENDFFVKDQEVLFLPAYVNFLKDNSSLDNLSEEKKNKIKRLLSLEAKDLMTKNPVTVPPDMDVADLLEFIRKNRFNTLPVTDDQKCLLGVVTLVDVIGMTKQSRDSADYQGARTMEEITKKDDRWKIIAILLVIFVVAIFSILSLL